MTLTYPALDAARRIVWLVTGADKVDALAKLLAGDTSIPAGRVENAEMVVVADEAAAPTVVLLANSLTYSYDNRSRRLARRANTGTKRTQPG